MFETAREINAKVDRWFRDRPKFRWLVLAVAHGAVYTALTVFVGDRAPGWGVSLGVVGGMVFATVYVWLQSQRRE